MYNTAFLDLPPLCRVAGTVRLPGSKSISNRVLLLAGLSSGTTVVHDLLASDDTAVMVEALQTLGCQIRSEGGLLTVTGIAARLSRKEASLFLGNAGTAMRPLTAVLAVLAASQGGTFTLRGVERMHERPIADLVQTLAQLGCEVEYLGESGYPPLRVKGHGQPLNTASPIFVRGDVSSQFLTSLLLALPLATEASDIVVEVQGELISKPYVDITLKMLRQFGIAIVRDGWTRFTVPQGSRYLSPGNVTVEGDASSASYFIGMGAIAATEQPLRIEGVGDDSIQGDIQFVEAARAMGAIVTCGPHWLEVRRGRFPLQAITLDCNHIPDAAMTLATMALFASGATRLQNIASWRVKETDRIAAMAKELAKFGARVVEGADFIEIEPPAVWLAAHVATYDDHRMAMSLSLAAFSGLVSEASALPVRIDDPRCVAKTFPDYFERFFSVSHARAGDIPVLTIDGPTASGKGTLAEHVARALGYQLLDSGALYRATALAAMRNGIDATDESALAAIAQSLPLRFEGGRTWMAGDDVTDLLRQEHVGSMSSQVSVWPRVREALRDLQLSFRRLPGLVADGRDMGTALFPDATLKVFLTASAATRAERRHKQLISKGISASIPALRADLEARDARDQSRSVSPLRPAEDAMLLDNSALTIDASVAVVLEAWQQRTPFG